MQAPEPSCTPTTRPVIVTAEAVIASKAMASLREAV